MCGRYYVDDETAREIERIIHIADEKVKCIPVIGYFLEVKTALWYTITNAYIKC